MASAREGDTLRRYRIEKNWYGFRTDALHEIAIEWCEEKIPRRNESSRAPARRGSHGGRFRGGFVAARRRNLNRQNQGDRQQGGDQIER
jgi:hypothetical protein